MFSTKAKKYLSVAVPMLIIGLTIAEPAQAEPVWDRIKSVTSNLGTVKTLIIYIAFLCGLGGIMWAGMDMFKKSKERGGDDVSWGGIGIKFVAGAVLVGLTVTTDMMRETWVGGGDSSSNVSNNQ